MITTTDRDTAIEAIGEEIEAAFGAQRIHAAEYADGIVYAIEAAGLRIVASGKPRCDGWIRDRDTEYRVYDGGNGQWEWERIVAGGVVAEGTITANDVADALRLAWECV